MRKFVLFLFLIVIVVLFYSVFVDTASYSITAESSMNIYGTVQDSIGNAIANATVTFVSEHSTVKAVTDSSGNYSALLSTVITGVEEPSTPQAFTLHQNFPNPFNPSTTIEYELKEFSPVKLTVYNIAGQLIRTLQDNYESVGLHRVVWDGRDERGNMVAAGVYLYHLESGTFTQSKKMVLLDGGGSVSVVSKAKRLIQGVSKIAKVSDMPYTITVEKPGYLFHTGDTLTASDASPEQEMNFVLYRIDPSLPYADAGPDLIARVRSYVILDGSGSYKGDGEKFEYRWNTDNNNNPVHISIRGSDDSKANTSFYGEGEYVLTLSINNDILVSQPDSVTITVLPREEIIFEDPNLEITIRYHLQKPVGTITEVELASIDSLRHYSVANCYKIKSIGGIENCYNLTRLDLGHQQIIDISPLSQLTKLSYLNLTQNYSITDISSLSELRELKTLLIDDNKITDISPLKNLIKLVYLVLMDNPIEDISVVANLKNLAVLYFDSAPFEDISALAELTNLQRLWLSKCDIMDISPVQNLTNLQLLYLKHNYITDLSPLEGLINIERFYLEDNLITDILPLVYNPGLDEGDLLELGNNPLSEQSINGYIPVLRDRGVTVTGF